MDKNLLDKTLVIELARILSAKLFQNWQEINIH
jgi:hypothetical protein